MGHSLKCGRLLCFSASVHVLLCPSECGVGVRLCKFIPVRGLHGLFNKRGWWVWSGCNRECCAVFDCKPDTAPYMFAKGCYFSKFSSQGDRECRIGQRMYVYEDCCSDESIENSTVFIKLASYAYS